MLAISQPTYLPWLGYFALINASKKIIFLDDVQLNSRSWQQRNRIINNDKISYLTVPVKKKGLRNQLINSVKIENKKIFRDHIKTIHHNYSKTKFFNKYYEKIENILIDCEKFDLLSDINIFIIKEICKILGININYQLSSDLNSIGKRADKLINICKILKFNEYLSNEGAFSYLDIEINKFKENNIKLFKLSVDNLEYKQQTNNFHEKLSIIDVIFNVGPDSLSLIKNSYKVSDIY
jgi:hypothetical protein